MHNINRYLILSILVVLTLSLCAPGAAPAHPGLTCFIIAGRGRSMPISDLIIAGLSVPYTIILIRMGKLMYRTAATGAAGMAGPALRRSSGAALREELRYKIPGYPVKIIASGCRVVNIPDVFPTGQTAFGKGKINADCSPSHCTGYS